MDQATAKLHWNNYLDSVKNGTPTMFTLHELSEYYKKQERNQKNRKAADRRVKKAERKGLRIRRSDQMTEHKAMAIKRLAAQGKKRNEIAEIVHVSYDNVDSVLRELTWKHVK